ncbi:MAG: hypothetical protein AMDU1_APLC00055G0006 [Thermoplasmatales archaeon A-plasma]|jgi:hypothetical protein|nr:MAG: hypothetical protein AMDU1_APLC00055G0006 [Thermoplasmatales archaeon A-plasma]WMT45540.1 MAG: hypothetical protein RE469_04915 [Cuniculiplasma divulgatum]
MSSVRDLTNGVDSSSGVAENKLADKNSNIPDSIAVGKGKVESGKGVIKAVKGKFLVLELVEEKGPCPDNMCQLEAKITARILYDINDPSLYEMIKTDRFTIAISKAVWRAIDRGRQNISIRKGRFGSLIVKGFSLTY